MFRFSIFALCLGALSACSSGLNEGAVHVSTVPVQSKSDPLKLDGKVFFASDGLKTSSAVIQPGENFSITLVSAFFCDFRELSIVSGLLDPTNAGAEACGGGLRGFPLANQESATRGEIAILAEFTERDGTNEVARDSGALYNFGRVIYYNEDVRETGQLSNEINKPIYGPIAYKKASTQLRIAMIEFDEAENERNKAILAGLAKVGGTAYPPAAPVMGILNSLGNTVINANKNDVEFLAEITFDPPSATSNVYRNPLQEGYYVFLRREDRSQDVDWDKLDLSICEAGGYARVMRGDCSATAAEDDKARTYRDDTWLLVRVSREDKDVAAAQNAGQLLAEFSQANLKRSADERSVIESGFTELETALGKIFNAAEECAKDKTEAKCK